MGPQDMLDRAEVKNKWMLTPLYYMNMALATGIHVLH